MNYKKLIGKTVYYIDKVDNQTTDVVKTKITKVNVYFMEKYLEVVLADNKYSTCEIKDKFPFNLKFNKKDFKKSDFDEFEKQYQKEIKALRKGKIKNKKYEINCTKEKLKNLYKELKFI